MSQLMNDDLEQRRVAILQMAIPAKVMKMLERVKSRSWSCEYVA